MGTILQDLSYGARMLLKKPGFTLIVALTLSPGICAKTAVATDKLIPRQILFANEDKLNVRLSPDGAMLSYLAPVDGKQGVWLCPVDDPSKAELLFKQTDAPAMNLQWAYTSRQLVYLKRVGPEVHLFVFDLVDRRTRDLTPQTGGSARIEKISPAHPEEILIGLNGRDPKRYDLHRINLRTGERVLILQNEEYDQFLCDGALRPRIARRQTAEQGYELFHLNATGRWELLERFTYDEARVSQPAALDLAGRTLYLIDNRRTNTGALRAIDLATGKTRTLATDALADFRSSVFLHPRTGRAQSVSAVYGRMRRYFLDPSIAADFKYLKTIQAGDIGVAGRSLDDRVWLVVFLNGGPIRYFVYDRRERRARFLFTEQSAVDQYPLARREAVVVPTRDGLKLPGDLYLPSWTRPGKRQYLGQPLPMLIYVHGGPSVAFGWNDWPINRPLQLLANRGYAVLRVEFRGAEGFGKKILYAGAGEWGRKMQNDILDAVSWAVKQGITERHRVGVWGWSYGGYATLAALTFTPGVFACGMAMFPPAELLSIADCGAGAFCQFWRRQLGDGTTDAGRAMLRERSPLYFVERINRPLLISHGAQDARLPRKHSDDFVAEMKKHNKPVTYLLYPDEGHDYARKENWISLFAVAERFFHEHLGGRYEPIGNDLSASNVEVLEGGHLIPDLATAIQSKAKSVSMK
jgi:dipeptidyl aminopeptidase/acylaminoacyl peptidase